MSKLFHYKDRNTNFLVNCALKFSSIICVCVLAWYPLGRPESKGLLFGVKIFFETYEVGATKKRKNEENRLNYAYFDAQLRENAL